MDREHAERTLERFLCDPRADWPSFLGALASAVAATEACAFTLQRDAVAAVITHIRPDESSTTVRRQAIEAFRDIANPCAAQVKDGVILITGTEDAAEPQYVLVLHVGDAILCFVRRCADSSAANEIIEWLGDARSRVEDRLLEALSRSPMRPPVADAPRAFVLTKSTRADRLIGSMFLVAMAAMVLYANLSLG